MTETKGLYEAWQSNKLKSPFVMIEGEKESMIVSYPTIANAHLQEAPYRENIQFLGFNSDKETIILQGYNLKELLIELMRWNISTIRIFEEEKYYSIDKTTQPLIEKIVIQSRLSNLHPK